MKLNENYNQYLDYRTKNSCTIVTFLNILKYDYNIFVIPSFFIKATVFLEKLWFINITKWATFWIIYPAMVRHLNKKLWLNFKLVKTTIPQLKETDKLTYSLGIKKYSSRRYWKAWSDRRISLIDIDMLSEMTGWIGHNLWYTPRMWWKIIDTKGENPNNMSVKVLKAWYKADLFWGTLRTIVPNPKDKRTIEIVKITKLMARAEYRNKLDDWIQKNGKREYFADAHRLYFYWR